MMMTWLSDVPCQDTIEVAGSIVKPILFLEDNTCINMC